MTERTIALMFICLVAGMLFGALVQWLDMRDKKPKRFCVDCIYMVGDSYVPFSKCRAKLTTEYSYGYVTRDRVKEPNCSNINKKGRCEYWEGSPREDAK